MQADFIRRIFEEETVERAFELLTGLGYDPVELFKEWMAS